MTAKPKTFLQKQNDRNMVRVALDGLSLAEKTLASADYKLVRHDRARPVKIRDITEARDQRDISAEVLAAALLELGNRESTT